MFARGAETNTTTSLGSQAARASQEAEANTGIDFPDDSTQGTALEVRIYLEEFFASGAKAGAVAATAP